MNLVAIEAPATGVAATREAFELLDAALRVVTASERLQVIADQLIKTLAKGSSLLPRSRDNLFIYG
jgi:hypothetical protein